MPQQQYSASSLRHQIEFLQRVSTPDGGGGRSISFVPLSPRAIVRALVQPRSSRERFLAGQTASAESVLIVIRYRTGLDQKMRIQYGSRQFEILGIVDVDERHAWLEMDCEERFGE